MTVPSTPLVPTFDSRTRSPRASLRFASDAVCGAPTSALSLRVCWSW